MKACSDTFISLLILCAFVVAFKPDAGCCTTADLFSYSPYGNNESINSIGLKSVPPLFDTSNDLMYVRLRIDYSADAVFSESRYDTTFYGLTAMEVYSFDQYVKDNWDAGVRNGWAAAIKKNFSGRFADSSEQEGLLPDIKLPVNLPKPLAAVIGRGGGLKVKGSNRISFGGSTTYLDPEPASEIRRASRFPDLSMDQVLRVNVEGTVGEKIHVFVDHDSEREFQTKNQVRVRYEGDEDEIIQEIELGDTKLSLPGSRFVSGTIPSQGLFGAKARGKLGDLDFTAVATKQENQIEKKTFQGHSSQDSLLIRDFNFQKNYHFSLVGRLEDFLSAGDSSLVPSSGTINLWVDDLNGTNNESGSEGTGGAVEATAMIDPDLSGQPEEYFGNFDLQRDGVDYTLDPSNLVVDFNHAILNDEVVAVSYVTVGGDTVGDISKGVLKLLKPTEWPDTSSATWDYQLRNQYYLGSTDIIESSLNIEIYKGDDQNPVLDEEINGVKRTYLNIFGLDDDSDGRVELNNIDFERGLLVFPDLQPFLSPSEQNGDSITITDTNRAMYYDDSPVSLGLQNNVYTIKVSYRSRTTSFNLGVLNVMEGSERVTVNGRVLQRGTDYDMIYEIGQIIFFNPDLLADDAVVNVDYEFAPLFAQSQVTMVGLRGDYQLMEGSTLSTTWLMQSEASIEQRPRLGDESRRMVIGEVDGNLAFEPEFMTSMADALPLVETDATSHLDIAGEMAVSFPNPNTRGEIFVDDFEGSSLIDSYSMSRRSWKFSSPPEGAGLDVADSGRLIWFNLSQGAVMDSDLNPRIPADQDRPRTVLRLDFTPSDSAFFPEESWRSIVQPLSNSGLDFSEKKFLNVWLNGGGGEVWLDLGTVSEDALRFDYAGKRKSQNVLLDTEDLNHDGKLDYDEDIGLDGVAGADETFVPGDDANDDFVFSETSYDKINGTEGNTFLDTEDLNGNNTLETDEKVFRYKIDLDRTYTADDTIKVISENIATGWKLYQIPVQQPGTSYDNPDFRRIKHLRVLLTGFDTAETVMVGSIEVEGNSWLDRGISGGDVGADEDFDVTVKNTNDNADYYSPPGVGAQRDPGVPADLQQIKEQSLDLIYEGLGPKHAGTAVQPLLTPQNYIDYRSISVWVRKDAEAGDSTDFFLQIGTDSLNYYEYSATPTSSWQEVVIPFKSLTDVKKHFPESYAPDSVYTEGQISVKGVPTLTNVRRLAVGVNNTGVDTVSGEIWVDEFRLTDVIRDRGIAQRLSVNAAFADLGKVQVGYVGQGDQFRQLNQNRRNLSTRDINMSTSLNMHKFMPASLGLRIPLSYSKNHGRSLPRYKTGSDILFDEGPERDADRVENLTETFKVGYSKGKASGNRFVRATVDKISSSFTALSSSKRGPVTRKRTRTENLLIKYDTPFGGDYDFPLFPSSLFGFFGRIPFPLIIKESTLVKGLAASRFRYLPESLGLVGKLDRSNILTINSQSGVRTPYRTFYTTEEINIKQRPLRSLSGSYLFHTERDLDQRKIEHVLGSLSFNSGTEIRRTQNFQYTYSPEVLSWLSPSYTYSARYNEIHTPEVSGSYGDSLDLRKFNNNTSKDLRVNVELPTLFETLAGGGTNAGRPTSKVGGGQVKRGEGENADEEEGLWRRGLLRASRAVKSATIRLGNEDMTDYQYVEITPPFLYQLGFKQLELEPREHRKSRNFSVDGGLILPAGISLTSGYAERSSDNDFRGSSRFSSGVTWPQLGADLPNLKLPGSIRKYLPSVNLSSHYSESRETSGTQSNGVESETDGTTWSPFLSLSTQMSNGLSVDYSLNRNETSTLNYTGSKNTNLKENSTHQVSLNYSVRSVKGFHLPLPWLSRKKIKLKSDLRFQLGYSRSLASEVVIRQDGDETEMRNTVTTTFTPSADYDFSRITTGLRFNYNVVNNRKAGQRTITIGANIWMDFIF